MEFVSVEGLLNGLFDVWFEVEFGFGDCLLCRLFKKVLSVFLVKFLK